MRTDVAIVVIGRNEGERLAGALRAALASDSACVVYVDSGSTDGSLERARGFGERVIVSALDPSAPFTPARGRNQGFSLVQKYAKGVRYVQFVDGDCVLQPNWLDAARQYLNAHPGVAVVAGRLREERRERNLYHRLADMEWDGPTGDVECTGGNAMILADAFAECGGFDASVAAGEELELALRLRARGFRIVRLDAEMARHDIDMERFSEWWKRSVRAGESYAEGLFLQHQHGQQLHLKEVLSILAYGLALPAAAVLSPLSGRLKLGLLAATYANLWWRVRRQMLSTGLNPKDAELYAAAAVVQKFSGTVGAARFLGRWARGELGHGAYLGSPKSFGEPIEASRKPESDSRI